MVVIIFAHAAAALSPALSPVDVNKLQSMHNLRDLAGTPCRDATARIKPGLVLRSATPADALPADADELLRCLPELSVLDLRSEEDAACDEGPRLLAKQTEHVEMLPRKTATKRLARHVLTDRLHVTLPLLPFRIMRSLPVPGVRGWGRRVMDRGIRRFLETIELADVYWWILNEQGAALHHALTTISQRAAGEAPTLIHCAHGKDRTGVVVAVVLHVCGANLEAIACDYALSDEWGCSPMGQDIMLQAMPERYRERIKQWNTPPMGEDLEVPDSPFFWAQFGKWCGADAQTMIDVFARLERRFGSVDAYLDSIGFGADDRKALSDALTCDA